MASQEEVDLFNEIIEAGCCKCCALRYLGYCKTVTSFSDPDTSLINFGFISPIEALIEGPLNKKQKNNPCIVCLGLLQDLLLEEILQENLEKIAEYQSPSFVSYITFPTCILVRDHSMKVHLKRTFPKQFNVDKVIKLNHAWRYSIEEKLCRKLKKTYDYKSKFTLHFYTSYLLEDDEMEVVQRNFSNKSNSLSKHNVTALLDKIPDEDFINVVKSPPRTPLYEVQLNGMKYFSEAIHLMGNYCKYSRELLLKPSTESEESIDRIITKAFRKIAGDCKEITFLASSFDEQSQRVLGHGRTFHLQCSDPKFASVTSQQCRKIEKEIKKSKILKVQNLHENDRRDIQTALDNEQSAPRSYKVLCIVYKCKNIDYCVNAVNMYTHLTIQQKTPIRVLATREQRRKRKKILFIRARRVDDSDNLIELDLSTESGLHVPEFINGDLGRTQPSLGDIMMAKVDVLAIDLLDLFSAA